MTPALVAADCAPPTPVKPALILTARWACGALAAVCISGVCGMIAAGPRQMSGGPYAAFLALQVATAVLLGFLAAFRPGPAHAEAFAAVAFSAAGVVAATFAILILRDDGVPRALTGFRMIGLAASGAAGVMFAMIRGRAATQAVLLQLAHRAIAIAIWVLVAKLILTAWGRPLRWVGNLLPAAVGMLALAALSAIAVLFTSRDDPDPGAFGESRHLAKVSAVMLAATLAWVIFGAVVTSR